MNSYYIADAFRIGLISVTLILGICGVYTVIWSRKHSGKHRVGLCIFCIFAICVSIMGFGVVEHPIEEAAVVIGKSTDGKDYFLQTYNAENDVYAVLAVNYNNYMHTKENDTVTVAYQYLNTWFGIPMNKGTISPPIMLSNN